MRRKLNVYDVVSLCLHKNDKCETLLIQILIHGFVDLTFKESSLTKIKRVSAKMQSFEFTHFGESIQINSQTHVISLSTSL